MGSAVTYAGGLVLICRLAVPCTPPGDEVWQFWLGAMLGISAGEGEP